MSFAVFLSWSVLKARPSPLWMLVPPYAFKLSSLPRRCSQNSGVDSLNSVLFEVWLNLIKHNLSSFRRLRCNPTMVSLTSCSFRPLILPLTSRTQMRSIEGRISSCSKVRSFALRLIVIGRVIGCTDGKRTTESCDLISNERFDCTS